jgi:hypothetical protein
LPIISERLNVFYRKVQNKRALASPPAIAFDTANELFSIAVNLDEWLLAAVAIHRYNLVGLFSGGLPQSSSISLFHGAVHTRTGVLKPV